MTSTDHRKESAKLAREDAQALENLVYDLYRFSSEVEVHNRDGQLYLHHARDKVRDALKRLVNYI